MAVCLYLATLAIHESDALCYNVAIEGIPALMLLGSVGCFVGHLGDCLIIDSGVSRCWTSYQDGQS